MGELAGGSDGDVEERVGAGGARVHVRALPRSRGVRSIGESARVARRRDGRGGDLDGAVALGHGEQALHLRRRGDRHHLPPQGPVSAAAQARKRGLGV